jgi:hypothetical protein
METFEKPANAQIEHDITMEILRRLDFPFPLFSKNDLESSNSAIYTQIIEFVERYELIQKIVHGKVLITATAHKSPYNP